MSSSFGNWFGKSKKQVSQPQPEQKPPETPKQTPGADHLPGAPYKKGDSFHEISEFFENSEIWLLEIPVTRILDEARANPTTAYLPF